MSAPQANEATKHKESAPVEGGRVEGGRGNGRGGRGGGRGNGGGRGRGGNRDGGNRPAADKPATAEHKGEGAAQNGEKKEHNNGERGGRRRDGGSRSGGRGGGRGRGGAKKDDAYDDDYAEEGAPSANSKFGNRPVRMTRLPLVKRNTEDFEPSFEPVDMRVVIDCNTTDFKSGPITVRDVVSAPMIFTKPGDADLYDRLVREIEACKIPQERLLKSWHGDSHWIADDTTGWKKSCPTFVEVCERMANFFKMDVKATRFNWYKDTSEWKPFHHDAAAVKADKARTQNFTVAASFGATRDAAFEHAKSRQVISFPQPSGTVYCFARDTNIIWRHGILQEPKEKQREEGRISIILWGIVNQDEVN